jgi:hypothetical protein
MHAHGTRARHGRGAGRRHHSHGQRAQGGEEQARSRDHGLHLRRAAGQSGRRHAGGGDQEGVVHDVDKMELLLQMVEYERSAEGSLDLGEFSRVAARIQLPEVKTWADDVLKERKTFWESKGKTPSYANDVEVEKKESQDQYYGAKAEANGEAK